MEIDPTMSMVADLECMNVLITDNDNDFDNDNDHVTD